MKNRSAIGYQALGTIIMGMVFAAWAAAQAPDVPESQAADGSTLAKMQIPDVIIASAIATPTAGAAPAGSGQGRMPTVALPAYCMVKGTIEKRIGAAGKPYGIGFELRMPYNWQGRFLFQGGGDNTCTYLT
jgi:hypothetical protein